MIKLLNHIISFIKKEPFELDKNISSRYLIHFLSTKFINLLRGIICLKSFKIIFVSNNTRILATHLITFGKNISIAEGCYIDALSKGGILLGNNVSIQKRTIIECTGSLRHLCKGLVLGNNVGIGSNSFLGCAGGIEIGDDTIIGNYVSFHSENHNFDRSDIPIRLQGVNHQGIKIGNNCWIGAKVTILDGTVVGDGCVIAAGAVLNGKTYPSNSVVGGVPAKVLKNRFE
jgi:acetyltransferase-like isoleucine patch superfamily enzyme